MKTITLAGLTVTSLTAALALSACATPGAEPTPPMAEGGDNAMCDAAPAQSLIGQKAAAETGAQLMKLTGAKQMRWVPPRTAVTMDFRADRLTVSYDDTMMIERISCG